MKNDNNLFIASLQGNRVKFKFPQKVFVHIHFWKYANLNNLTKKLNGPLLGESGVGNVGQQAVKQVSQTK